MQDQKSNPPTTTTKAGSSSQLSIVLALMVAMVTGFGYAFLAAAVLTGMGIIVTALLKQESHRQAEVVVAPTVHQS